MTILDDQLVLLEGFTDHGVQATLTLAQGFEGGQILRRHRQHVTFLGFVAPDFQRAHAGFGARHGAQVEQATATAILDQLRQCVGQTARADVVDEADRVLVIQRPAAIDDFLHATLHLGVVTLHGGEIEVFAGAAGGHGRGSTAAQTDQHRRAAHHDQLGADRNIALLDVLAADVAVTAGEHDRLVIATTLDAAGTEGILLVGTEVAVEVGSAEFVVERSATDRAFEHDVVGGLDALRLAVVVLPRLFEARDTQVGDAEAGQTRFRLGADTGRAFITNLATGTGRGARIRGDGGRVVVGLDLHQDVDRFLMVAIDVAFACREVTPGSRTFHHGGVVTVGGQHAIRMMLVGVLDHLEQRVRLRFAVDGPVRIEDLVAAMLGVRLSEHHQFDVGRIAAQSLEGLDQIIDLVIGQRQPQATVGLGQGFAATAEDVDMGKLGRCLMLEQTCRVLSTGQYRLGHAVVQSGGQRGEELFAQGRVQLDAVGDATLEAADLRQAAVGGDIRGLGRPGRQRAEAGDDEEEMSFRSALVTSGAVVQQALQCCPIGTAQFTIDLGQMKVLGMKRFHLRHQLA